MGYVGQAPNTAILTAADITDGIIANVDIASDAAIAMSKTTLSAGTGLTLSTNTLNVDASQTGITAVGTISTGTWEGDTVAVNQGGTGATSLTNLFALGTHTTGDYVQNITAGTGLTSSGATSGENIAHSLSVDASQGHVTTVGALDAGSITSGFGAIDIGSDTITTTGAVATGELTVTGDVNINTDFYETDLSVYGADIGEGDATGQIAIKDSAAFGASPKAGIIFVNEHTSGSQAVMGGIGVHKNDGADSNYGSYMSFATRAHGAVSVRALTLTENQNVVIEATKKLYLDGSTGAVGDTYIYQESTDDLHITVGGAIMVQLDQEAGLTTFNPSSADYDFKVLTDNGTAAISVDAGVNGTVGSVTLGYTANPDANNRAWFKVYPPALSTASGKSTSWVGIQPDYAMTMVGTVPVAASLAIEEPNLSGTPTLAATLYIKDAPDEATTNAAIYVASGDQYLASGGLVVGHSARLTTEGDAALQITGNASSALTQMTLNAFSTNDNVIGVLDFTKSNSETIGTSAIVSDGDLLGDIRWAGADGTDWNDAARIRGIVDGSPSDGTDMPGALLFMTSPNGSGSPTEALRINSSQHVRIAERLVIDGNNGILFEDAGKWGISYGTQVAGWATVGDGTTYNGVSIYPGSALYTNFPADGTIQPEYQGAVGTPTYTFQDDPDTGMYQSQADYLDFASGGTKALTLDSSQKATFEENVRTKGAYQTDWNYQGTVSGSTAYTIASAIPANRYDVHRWFIVQTHNNYSYHISYGYVTRQSNDVINLYNQEIRDAYGGSLAITDNGDDTYDLVFTTMTLGGKLMAGYDFYRS